MRRFPYIVMMAFMALIAASCSPSVKDVLVDATVTFDSWAEWDTAMLTIYDGFHGITAGPVTPEEPVFRIGIPEGRWKFTVVTYLDGTETSRGGSSSYLPFPLNGKLSAELFFTICE